MSIRRDILGMNRTLLIWVLPLAAAGCWTSPDDSGIAGEAPPPAAALTEIGSATPLDEGLRLLEEELTPILQQELDDAERNERLLRAEAIADRLLETRLPFEWLAADNYGLAARLRQIQALADRVIAQMRSGAPRDSIISGVASLRSDVTALRESIARGGTRAPPSLEELLTDFESTRRRPPPPRPPPAATPPDTSR